MSQGYLLTRRERRTGTPEKPLSQLGNCVLYRSLLMTSTGALTYQSYWKDAILSFLLHQTKHSLSIYGWVIGITYNSSHRQISHRGLASTLTMPSSRPLVFTIGTNNTCKQDFAEVRISSAVSRSHDAGR